MESQISPISKRSINSQHIKLPFRPKLIKQISLKKMLFSFCFNFKTRVCMQYGMY